MKARSFAVLAVVAVSAAAAAPAANTPKKSDEGDAEAGRALALQACTGCHVVEPDQPFKPIYTGKLPPPDFKEIANKPDVTAAMLVQRLESLPTIPDDSRMANPDLTSEQLRDIAAFIVTLRDKPAAAAR